MNQDLAKAIGARSKGVMLKNITKVFPAHDGSGDVTAVDNIDLEIKDGELITLLGPSGCGKTTTLRMISGFETPSEGEIFIGDRPVANVPPNKRDIAMVFQSYALFPHLTIYENVAYGLKVHKIPKLELQERTQKAMELMQLKGMENRYPNQLSGGQQQRVALARAIIIEPKVLLFDEPLSNLDAKLREHMRDELRSIQKRLGITSLYVTHDQAEAMAISDKVVIMKDGVIMQNGTPQEIYEYPESRFVAHFIGKANFIPCQCLKKKKEGTTVLLDGGMEYQVPFPGNMRDVAEGGECVLSVRPESIQLSSTEGLLQGTIKRATYYGARIEYEILYKDLPVIVEIQNPQLSQRFNEGDTVYMNMDDICVRVLSSYP
ncbi:MAG: ABC transporter ATP-binding protein [Lachnospiraceae bacterium]